MIKRDEQSEKKKLTEFDETTLDMSKGYLTIAIICLVLAFMSIFTLWGDTSDEASGAFVVSIINAVTMIFLIIVIFIKARRVFHRKKAVNENRKKS